MLTPTSSKPTRANDSFTFNSLKQQTALFLAGLSFSGAPAVARDAAIAETHTAKTHTAETHTAETQILEKVIVASELSKEISKERQMHIGPGAPDAVHMRGGSKAVFGSPELAVQVGTVNSADKKSADRIAASLIFISAPEGTVCTVTAFDENRAGKLIESGSTRVITDKDGKALAGLVIEDNGNSKHAFISVQSDGNSLKIDFREPGKITETKNGEKKVIITGIGSVTVHQHFGYPVKVGNGKPYDLNFGPRGSQMSVAEKVEPKHSHPTDTFAAQE